MELAGSISRLGRVASGAAPATLVIRGCTLLSTYTGEELPGTDVAVSGDRIAYVGPDASHAVGPRTTVIDAGGKMAGPGLADPHTHIDQFAPPAEFAARALLRGTTALFSDPVDVTAIGGYRGFAEFARLCAMLPVRVFQTVPGGVPVDPAMSNCRTMSDAERRRALGLPGVAGTGEVFAWTKVVAGERGAMRMLGDALRSGLPVNGHTAGMSGKKLCSYVSSGIFSCHEPIDAAQAIERLRLGMWVMAREGSIRRDLAAILSGVLESGVRTDRLMFCTDGVDPGDMSRYGHMDHCMREAVRLGMGPAHAAALASTHAFEYYGMGADLGGVAPGKLADIVIFERGLRPETVIVGGRIAASGGRVLARRGTRRPAPWTRRTVRLGRMSGDAFAAPSGGASATAATIKLRTEIITSMGEAELPVRGGQVVPDGASKVASFDRIGRTGARTVAFMEGFGADCALASTWCFHEGDLLVIGTDDADMALAANRVIGAGGGIAVSRGGRVRAFMPLALAGVASSRPFDEVAESLAGINSELRDAGCPLDRPHLVPLFLEFLALPSVRILSSGLVDVRGRRYVRPYT
ncbi:Adenine deaminase [Nitrosopumilaceae archaeon]|nr:amidohydrolase family protein [Nitrosopumilus sp.]MDA7954675.1 amidohydrolase family protein [Nitrosopumilus sp.]MDA7973651.1 amidohydrolase family protein [Nitrosopumilus sp.]CAI9832637.1 Adenine deaminase [Nitrosopumilaceae archaeon]